MKSTLALIVAGLVSSSAIGQSANMEMTKQQFLDIYENAAANQDKIAEYQHQNKQRLKDQMPPDVYEQMVAEETEIEKKRKEKIASCAGVSLEKLEQTEENVTPKAMLSLVKQCSNTLPDTIPASENMDWSRNPALADFIDCTDVAVKKEYGLSLKKLNQCESDLSEQEENDADW